MSETRAVSPRLRWRTNDDHWATTTAEGWEYRVRYKDLRFTSVRVTPTGAEAFVWTCASLAQAKFSVFADVRRRRWEAEASPVTTPVLALLPRERQP